MLWDSHVWKISANFNQEITCTIELITRVPWNTSFAGSHQILHANLELDALLETGGHSEKHHCSEFTPKRTRKIGVELISSLSVWLCWICHSMASALQPSKQSWTSTYGNSHQVPVAKLQIERIWSDNFFSEWFGVKIAQILRTGDRFFWQFCCVGMEIVKLKGTLFHEVR